MRATSRPKIPFIIQIKFIPPVISKPQTITQKTTMRTISLSKVHPNLDVRLETLLANEQIKHSTNLNLSLTEVPSSQAILKAQAILTSLQLLPDYNNLYTSFEEITINTAKVIFDCQYANVRSISSNQMYNTVLSALLSQNDTILGLDTKFGGSFDHNSTITISNKTFKTISYGICPESGWEDIADLLSKTMTYRPKLIVASPVSCSSTIDWFFFRRIADLVGALLLADISHIAAQVATKSLPSPLFHCDLITMATNTSLRGPSGGLILTNKQPISERISAYQNLNDLPKSSISDLTTKAQSLAEVQQPSFRAWMETLTANTHALTSGLSKRNINIPSNWPFYHQIPLNLTNLKITPSHAKHWLNRCYILITDPDPLFSLAWHHSSSRLSPLQSSIRSIPLHELRTISDMIGEALLSMKDNKPLPYPIETNIRMKVLSLADSYPVYIPYIL
ncbi:Serine hydroxymethyltransferase [Candidatus Hodgkinia cicadicola]|uniref:Serine hydroxymethyltransferase n=1 Tax=Candidatus Hodgkinia cicadicola TaxID=573658 RepID=A0ABX4MF29_9HYPH|nr:Serine hydroxymethyltransferase [Candidatus Hodgkinia cicadicola]